MAKFDVESFDENGDYRGRGKRTPKFREHRPEHEAYGDRNKNKWKKKKDKRNFRSRDSWDA